MSGASEDALHIHPAFVLFKQVIPLAGFSGAAIALVRNPGRTPFVRKAAMHQATNDVLRNQAARQNWLREQLTGAAGVPDILDQGEIDGLYYFDMEFVPSRDANAFLHSASFEDIERFADNIEGLLRHLSERRLPNRAAPAIEPLLLKLAEIDHRTGRSFTHLLAPLREMVEALGSFPDGAGATATHGDLTFENILVGAKHGLWLIDPIQSPIDHYWLDWTKLFQECEGHWYLHRGRRLSLGVTHWLRNRWLGTATAMEPAYALWHPLLLALTFARILPYTKTPQDLDFVTGRIAAFAQTTRRSMRG